MASKGPPVSYRLNEYTGLIKTDWRDMLLPIWKYPIMERCNV